MLHSLQTSNPGFDPRPNLFVLLQEGRPLADLRVLTLFQRPVFLFQLCGNYHELVQAAFQPLQLLGEGFVGLF